MLVCRRGHARACDGRHRATCSPGSSPRSWRKAWTRASLRPPARSRTAAPPSSRPQQVGLVASDVIDALPRRARLDAPLGAHVDLGALRRNVRTLLRALDGVAAVGRREGRRLRPWRGGRRRRSARRGSDSALRRDDPRGPRAARGLPDRADPRHGARPARTARWRRRGRRRSSSRSPTTRFPRGSACTSSSTPAWGGTGSRSCPPPPAEVVGLMTHLATADSDLDFARRSSSGSRQRRRSSRTSRVTPRTARLRLRLPESHFDAARCGIAIYGLSPFDGDPADDGLEPVLSWQTHPRAGEAARSGTEHGLRPALRRRTADLDRDRPRRLRGRLPPRPHRYRGSRRAASRVA